jgi:hypothetical protein
MYHSDEGRMRTETFEKFVASQQETNVAKINWERMRDEWLGDLDSLYRQVTDFLREYTKAGSISYKFTRIELTEENIGKYLARRMDIKIGRQALSLMPVGTLLIGSKGRVDAVGSGGHAQILLVDKRARSAADLIKVTVMVKGGLPPSPPTLKEPISWVWKIVSEAAPKRFVDLNKDSFLALLMKIANA